MLPLKPSRRFLHSLAPLMAALAAAGLVFGGLPQSAQAQAADPARTTASNSALGPGFADLVQRLSPAVVGISAMRTPAGMPRDRAHAGITAPSTGSGFVVDPSGIVVTNNHVIEGASQFEVSLADGAILPARLVGRDPETDLAVLRVEPARPLAFVRWGNSDQARVGDWAIAIGSPFGLGGSVSVGVISGRNRDLQAGRFDDFLQTDAAINRGNSGGPLFNGRGEVIGVNTAIVSPGGAQGGSVGVGFSVPANLARKVVDDIQRAGAPQRGWIGLRARVARPEEGRGAVVTEVLPGSPAARGGLRPGDLVTGFGGRPIPDPRALARAVADAARNDRVRIDGMRGRQRIFANVIVSVPPGETRPQADTTGLQTYVSLVGLSLRAAAASDRERSGDARVVVAGVDPFGPARGVVEPGDGLMEVQGRPVASPAQARAILEETARARDAITLRLSRNGASLSRAIRSRR